MKTLREIIVKFYASCSLPQFSGQVANDNMKLFEAIARQWAIAQMPKKKKIDDRFDWTFQNRLNKKFNEAIDQAVKNLENDREKQ